MNSAFQFVVYGSLKKTVSDDETFPRAVEMAEPTPLSEILGRFKIPLEMVQLVMVNHKAVPKDTLIHPGDRLTLFPREYPIFPDWYDYRLQAPSV